MSYLGKGMAGTIPHTDLIRCETMDLPTAAGVANSAQESRFALCGANVKAR